MSLRTLIAVGLFSLVLPRMAVAELAVCFDPVQVNPTGHYTGSQFQHNPSIDPSKVTDPRCSVVTKASGRTTEQLSLINSTIRGVPASRYLVVTGGYAVPMTAAEMDGVDADLAAKQQQAQTFTDEVAIQDFCNTATLDEVTAKVNIFYDNAIALMTAGVNGIDVAKMQADIGVITTANTTTNITAIKTALTTIATQVSNAKSAITTTSQQLSNERSVATKTLRCLLSVRKGAR